MTKNSKYFVGDVVSFKDKGFKNLHIGEITKVVKTRDFFYFYNIRIGENITALIEENLLISKYIKQDI